MNKKTELWKAFEQLCREGATAFGLSLIVLGGVVILAHKCKAEEITPQSQPDCTRVVCTTDGAQLPKGEDK